MKIATVIGARPQFIKAAVVSRAICEHNKHSGKKLAEVVIHTGQHYDSNMSAVFFSEMRIPEPSHNLAINGSNHGAMTGLMMQRLEEVFVREKPDVALVYGDTNSTLAGALTAAKLQIPVAHVEAGLRSFNFAMPEEVNRVVTDRLSTWLFCPSANAVDNLRAEGFFSGISAPGGGARIHKVGDVMCDAALFYRGLAKPSTRIESFIAGTPAGFYLATLHRAENTDDPNRLAGILKALDEIARTTPVVFPVHPRTKKMLSQAGLETKYLKITDPLGYFDIIALLGSCKGVFTDSGGLQKEAYFFARPCVTLRDETEWNELVEQGCNRLAGADYDRIIRAEMDISACKTAFPAGIYGQGDAGEKIIGILANGF